MRFLKKFNDNKLLHCSSFFWKKIFLYTQYPIFKVAEKKIMSRSSIIPKIFSNTSVKIYSGNSWHRRNLNKWMIGFKFGEFTWNRKLALYKAKQLKKKKTKK
jgi:ribosomal protein S19